jgi:hypothetical protein
MDAFRGRRRARKMVSVVEQRIRNVLIFLVVLPVRILLPPPAATKTQTFISA